MKNLFKLGLVVIVVFALSACGGDTGVPDEGNPLPEARENEDVGGEAARAAETTPEATWDNYLRDIIASQLDIRTTQTSLLQRYENPDITAQNTGGLYNDLDLVEDRTEFSVNQGSGTANATTDFDVRITRLDGDTETLTCSFQVNMERTGEGDEAIWYVINPAPLAVFAVCN